MLFQLGMSLALCLGGALFFNYDNLLAATILWIAAIPSFCLLTKTLYIGNGEIVSFDNLPKRYNYTLLDIRCGVAFLEYYGTAEIFHEIKATDLPDVLKNARSGTEFTISVKGSVTIY
ncbi:MAG: hypothetical protein UW95_C0007G0032 [Parcubacteria group bacterium GW2011_GWC1_45_14]|nr:MAG: hypothetical protein UW95_C0007G0032 [Parcubacteria group bacterium GW2011_GWC1_45_14]